jgi:hypothetical protein
MTIRGQDSMEPPKFDDSSDTLELMPVVDLEVSETVWFSKNGWYSAVDVGVMKQSDTMFGTDGTWGEEVAAPRLTIGWENEEGYGVRGKLWHYKSSTDPFTVDREINSTLLPGVAGSVAPLRPYFVLDQPREYEAITFDLDLYKRLDWGSNEFTFGSGIKSVGQTTTLATTDTLWGSQSRLEGVGISLFASGRKSLYATEKYDVAFVTEGRASFLWGDKERSGASYSYDSNENFSIYEAGAGVEWRRELPSSVVYLRTQYETQLWDLNGGSTVGFTGANVSLGITW